MNKFTSAPIVANANLDSLPDPSLSDGYSIIFEGEIPIKIKNYNANGTINTMEPTVQPNLIPEMITVRILTNHVISVRMELSNEADLFFHYSHSTSVADFPDLQLAQKLLVDLGEYPSTLINLLDDCAKNPQVNIAILSIHDDSDAQLDFVQNFDYKFVDLMYCVCSRTPEQLIQKHLAYRYNAMKRNLLHVRDRLDGIHNLIRIKNPPLMLQLQRNEQQLSSPLTSYLSLKSSSTSPQNSPLRESLSKYASRISSPSNH